MTCYSCLFTGNRALNTVTQNLAESGVGFTWVLLLKSHTMVNIPWLSAHGGVKHVSLKQHQIFTWMTNTWVNSWRSFVCLLLLCHVTYYPGSEWLIITVRGQVRSIDARPPGSSDVYEADHELPTPLCVWTEVLGQKPFLWWCCV